VAIGKIARWRWVTCEDGASTFFFLQMFPKCTTITLYSFVYCKRLHREKEGLCYEGILLFPARKGKGFDHEL